MTGAGHSSPSKIPWKKMGHPAWGDLGLKFHLLHGIIWGTLSPLPAGNDLGSLHPPPALGILHHLLHGIIWGSDSISFMGLFGVSLFTSFMG